MLFSGAIIALTACSALTVAHPGLMSRANSCSTSDGAGICKLVSSCAGFTVSGLCPGAADHECCVHKSCSTSSGAGLCKNTTSDCSNGVFVADACPGDGSVECCVRNKAPKPSPTYSQAPLQPKRTGSRTASHLASSTSTALAAVDISNAKSSSFWTCLAKTHQKVVLKGYGQSCSTGGAVNTAFVSSYNAAKAAGIPKVDAYLFPCTGTQAKGKCKSPATQLAEFEAAISGAGMTLDYRWFDVEPKGKGDACNAWNLGNAANLALAKQWTALLRQSGNKWGIYANGNQWTAMFASRSTDIGSDLPLWAVQDDHKPGVSTVHTFMGGWTSAVGKQYDEDVQVCGSGVDKDSFSS